MKCYIPCNIQLKRWFVHLCVVLFKFLYLLIIHVYYHIIFSPTPVKISFFYQKEEFMCAGLLYQHVLISLLRGSLTSLFLCKRLYSSKWEISSQCLLLKADITVYRKQISVLMLACSIKAVMSFLCVSSADIIEEFTHLLVTHN